VNKNATLNRQEGTSVSSSILSGAVALVREFYSKNMAILSFKKKLENPSGVLLKALIIHSAQPMTGIVLLKNYYLNPYNLPNYYPNEFNGFGLPDLSFILPFKNEQILDNQPNFSIFVENLNYYNVGDEKFSYTFNITNSTQISKFPKYLRATLSL
jgi:hypothetical protein